ncbi:hypothetical protein [Streptomyces sp. NPDC090022]|uniref:hypothetical protein n=1 Tax=Streptomyces sp. NPDC090022 TaxID=3365920 RepID=UPI0037F60718
MTAQQPPGSGSGALAVPPAYRTGAGRVLPCATGHPGRRRAAPTAERTGAHACARR